MSPISPEGDCRGAGEAGQPDEERSGADERGHHLVLREAGKPPRGEPGAIQGGAGARCSGLVLQVQSEVRRIEGMRIRNCSCVQALRRKLTVLMVITSRLVSPSVTM